jgi:predicted HicB family RNase H-like nuclease
MDHRGVDFKGPPWLHAFRPNYGENFMSQAPQLKIRLPSEIKAFIAKQAEKNGSNLNSEVIRSIRERMERTSMADRR